MDKHTYYITNNNNEYLKYEKENKIIKDKEKFDKVLLERDNQYKFSCLEDKDLNEDRYGSIFTKEFSSEDAYVLEKIDDNFKKDLLIVRSSMCLFRYFTSFYKNNKNQSGNNNANQGGSANSPGELDQAGGNASGPVSTEYYVEVLLGLENIVSFLFDMDVGADSTVDIYDITDEPIPIRQKILKDIGFIDVLIDIIYYPFRYEQDLLEYLDDGNPIKEVMSMTYTCLRYSIAEFRPNELYASQWLNFITDQALQTKEQNDIKAGQTLTELIDNNERI